ncbi:MAG: hypothetical protein IPI33_08935 [Dehalococcoidia bacterium]|nr:hypothetical protein [Dehalococcoidia bacterium]
MAEPGAHQQVSRVLPASPMRIAEINDIASVASEIGAGLRARGHEVTLFHPRLVGASLHPQVKPITAPVRALDWMDLIRRIRAGNFELVHIHYAYLGNIGSLGGFPTSSTATGRTSAAPPLSPGRLSAKPCATPATSSTHAGPRVLRCPRPRRR